MQLPSLDDHEAHFVPGYKATKTYTCPECDHAIHPGSGHVVAWPSEAVEQRRHWHRNCWRMRVRRGRLA